MPVVLKPLTTHTQRLPIGAEVNEGDDLSPHTFEDLKERGFIGDEAEAKSESKFGSSYTARSAEE